MYHMYVLLFEPQFCFLECIHSTYMYVTIYYILLGIGTLLCVDGQKIAIRLSRRIAVVSKLLKKSLALYNSGIDASCHLSWSEAIGLSS